MQLVKATPEAMARFILSMKESPMGAIRVPVRVSNLFDASRYWRAISWSTPAPPSVLSLSMSSTALA